nr:alkaline phosphatase family protein [Streptomyces alanosinicus]
MYDENDGYFDHVIPPFPEPGTKDEFANGKPIGLGSRVPLWVVSLWSRGGWVNSQVFDHTSVLRFLERVTGVQEPNISDWRRTVSGDLTSCFDFSKPDYSIPGLPDTVALMAKADAGDSLPAVKIPDQQSMPAQEKGSRPHRALPYRPWADVRVERATGKVTCTLTHDGSVGYHFTVLPNIAQPSPARRSPSRRTRRAPMCGTPPSPTAATTSPCTAPTGSPAASAARSSARGRTMWRCRR